MNYSFDMTERHAVSVTNKNVYLSPVLHPTRIMNEHDFVYIIDGTWSIGLENEVYNLKKNDVIILPAGLRHFGTALCKNNTSTFFIHTTVVSGDGISFYGRDSNLKCSVPLPTVIQCADNPKIKELFYEILIAFKQDEHTKASVLFDMLLLSLYDTNKSYEYEKKRTARSIRSMIDMNLHKGITVSYISKKLNISEKTAEKAFKREYETTIHKYIISQKMLIAKDYLENYSNMKIYEIASNLGFYDEYHFSRTFKKHFGISPYHYKTKNNANTFFAE